MVQTKARPLNRKLYYGVLNKIELQKIRLVELHVKSSTDDPNPGNTVVGVQLDSSAEQRSDGFSVTHGARISFTPKGEKEPIGRIKITLKVLFSQSEPIEQDIFDRFFMRFATDHFLLITWPFLRELVSNTMLRFEWPPHALPLENPYFRETLQRAAKA